MHYFTVGPSQLYPIVPRVIKKALSDGITSVSHRDEVYITLQKELVHNLKSLLTIPKSYSIFFLSSGTEAMERIIQNTVTSHSHHLVNGSFSDRFYQTALELGKSPTKTEVTIGESFDWNSLHIPSNTELLCATHNETSTGVMIPLNKLYQLKMNNPNLLIALDTVSSMPYADVDFSKIDMTFFSVQKGFGMPAGLGVIIVSPQALKYSSGSYHSFNSLKQYADKNQTPETPNVLGIHVLNEVVKDMLKEGITSIRHDIETKSDLIAAFVKSSQSYTFLAQDPLVRSKTIHVLKTRGGSSSLIRRLVKKGFLVSSGYSSMKNDYIRIATFPSHELKMVKKLLQHL
ncbi:MAG: aminotransferase class V-fold PLP-dependent enzyme [bacterium]|nr:aminotransferase class V-fold PLP-dependent enzyme [bacterium]